MAKKTVTLYLEAEPYLRLRRLVMPKSVSRDIDELIRKRVAELESREYDAFEEADYEALLVSCSKILMNSHFLQTFY